jgi:uncharacterized protein YjbI with pentapeptide repeats
LAPSVRIFSSGEKSELAGQVFRELLLDRVDFSGADLRNALFHTVSLRGCDFRGADLRRAAFVDCDLREADLEGTSLEEARFHGSWVGGATGLTALQEQLVSSRGGVFLLVGDCPTARLVGASRNSR